jgi:hypothetical protein
MPVNLDIGLVDVSAVACLAAPASPQTFSQCRCEIGFPVANRLVTAHDAADQEHLALNAVVHWSAIYYTCRKRFATSGRRARMSTTTTSPTSPR